MKKFFFLASKLIDDYGQDTVSSVGGTLFKSNHSWSSCCTDGLVIGSLENNWEMLVQFTAKPTGLNSWFAYSPLSEIPLAIDPKRRVRLDIVSPTETPASVPEPTSTFGLLAFATFGAASLLKRKQLKKL